MQTYELTYIIADSVAEDATAEIMQQVSKELEKHGAVIMKEESWGRRKLAYPIKKSVYGTYVTLQTHLEGAKVKQVDRFLRLNPAVIRHLMLVAVHTITKATDEAELAEALDKRVEETVAKKPAKKKTEAAAEVTQESPVTPVENVEESATVTQAPAEKATKPATRTRKPKTAATEDDKKAENEAERKKLVEEKLNEILGE